MNHGVAIGLAWGVCAVTPLAAQLAVREISLGVRPDGVVAHTVAVSAAMRLAYVVESTAGDYVVVDGVRGRPYTDIDTRLFPDAGSRLFIEFSPDGKRFGYAATQGTKRVVVVDGVEGPEFDNVSWNRTLFSPNSRHYAYSAQRDTQYVAVIDGRVSRAYASVSPPTYTADGSELLYVAREDGEMLIRNGIPLARAQRIWIPLVLPGDHHRVAYVVSNGDSVAVAVDGVPGKSYRSIGNWIRFTRDGRRVFYVARDSLYHVVVDGVEGPGYRFIVDESAGFSKDGEHFAYVAGVDSAVVVVVDGKIIARREWISLGYSPQFDPRTSRLTYTARVGDRYFAVIGERETERFDFLEPYYAPDGRVLYKANRGTRQFVGVDTDLFEFDSLSAAFITQAGHLTISARRGREWHVFVDGVSTGPVGDAAGFAAPSADGTRIATVTHRGAKWLVSLDGAIGKEYDEVQWPHFSPNNRHLAYAARRLDKWVVVIDGVESPTYDAILTANLATAESFTFIGRRGREDLRVSIAWPRD